MWLCLQSIALLVCVFVICIYCLYFTFICLLSLLFFYFTASSYCLCICTVLICAGDLSAFSRTDADWADGELMRVLPLLEWSYADVWHYARSRRVPYCVLYERGYSSLGSRHSTRPNPRLLVRPSTDSSSTSTTGLSISTSTSTSTSTDSANPVYRPAYELPDADAEERRGRLDCNSTATATSSRSSN